jgi:hypothetical protein
MGTMAGESAIRPVTPGLEATDAPGRGHVAAARRHHSRWPDHPWGILACKPRRQASRFPSRLPRAFGVDRGRGSAHDYGGPRRLPVLQRPPHGPDRRSPRRSRHPAGARAAVGDLRTPPCLPWHSPTSCCHPQNAHGSPPEWELAKSPLTVRVASSTQAVPQGTGAGDEFGGHSVVLSMSMCRRAKVQTFWLLPE